jgi:hypothetical protein
VVQKALRNYLHACQQGEEEVPTELTNKIREEYLREDIPEVDKMLFPHVHLKMMVKVAVQVAGEAIFVPSGWAHQVHNLIPTVSINHNWFNAVNLREVWGYLKEQLQLVRLSVFDCREDNQRRRGSLSLNIGEGKKEDEAKRLADRAWDEEWEKHCQMMMKINCGSDWNDFGDLLMEQSSFFARLAGESPEMNSIYYTIIDGGETYLSFSLKQLKYVLEEFAEDIFVRNYLIAQGMFINPIL